MKVLKLVSISLVGLCLYSCGNTFKGETKSSAPAPKKVVAIPVASLAVPNDPVCGMTMKKDEIADTAIYEGKVYGFCGSGCKDEFVKTPSQYLTQ
jgi:YHS domain-containing protein